MTASLLALPFFAFFRQGPSKSSAERLAEPEETDDIVDDELDDDDESYYYIIIYIIL